MKKTKEIKEFRNVIHFNNVKPCKGLIEFNGSYYRTDINADGHVEELTLLLGNNINNAKEDINNLKQLANSDDDDIRNISSEFLAFIRLAIIDQRQQLAANKKS